MDAKTRRAGCGVTFKREELAAIGYHTGRQNMVDIADGTYGADNTRFAIMGPRAYNYLTGYRYWFVKADQWICGEQVLECG
jgi:hypothetical protein